MFVMGAFVTKEIANINPCLGRLRIMHTYKRNAVARLRFPGYTSMASDPQEDRWLLYISIGKGACRGKPARKQRLITGLALWGSRPFASGRWPIRCTQVAQAGQSATLLRWRFRVRVPVWVPSKPSHQLDDCQSLFRFGQRLERTRLVIDLYA